MIQIKKIYLKITKFIYILFSFNLRVYHVFLKYFVSPAFEHKVALNKIVDVNNFIDVGANKGQFSLMVKLFHPNCKILAFEPLKTEFIVFKRIFINSKDIKIYNVALGKKTDRMKIYITKKKDSSSILLPQKKQLAFFPRNYVESIESVNVNCLKNFTKKIRNKTCLKIDVQGYELEVLKGTNFKYIEYIIIECSTLKLYKNQALYLNVDNYLKKKKYKIIYEYSHFFFKNKLIQKDILYKKIK